MYEDWTIVMMEIGAKLSYLLEMKSAGFTMELLLVLHCELYMLGKLSTVELCPQSPKCFFDLKRDFCSSKRLVRKASSGKLPSPYQPCVTLVLQSFPVPSYLVHIPPMKLWMDWCDYLIIPTDDELFDCSHGVIRFPKAQTCVSFVQLLSPAHDLEEEMLTGCLLQMNK